MADAPTVVRGTVEQVVFTNPESGWTILRLGLAETSPAAMSASPVTVVGSLGPTPVGTQLEITGRWENSPKYGRQFRADQAAVVVPSTVRGIRAYLASGVVEGMGAGLADRLVQAFGQDTLKIIQESPERLTEVEGIGAVRADRIQQALSSQLGLQATMVFLHGLGVSASLAAKIHRRYGENTAEVVQREPFRLALEVRGVGFKTADQLATQLGVARDSPQRAQAGLLHVLAESAQDGHVFVPREALFAEARRLLGPHGGALDEALQALEDDERAVRPKDSADDVYSTVLYEAETQVILNLRRLLDIPSVPLTEAPEDLLADFEQASGLRLAPAQRDALALANRARVLVVTGGPGTGKTTLVRGLLRLFQHARLRIELTAPTGRAAKRMTEATGLEARTIHRLLAYDAGQQTFLHNPDYPLRADVLIVDEVSMVDIPLMAALTTAIPNRARLILVGDVDQLPSVGPGQVLRDLIDSGRVPVARLDVVFRQGDGSQITANAHRINRGDPPQFSAPSRSPGDARDFFLIERDDPVAAQSTLLNVVADRIPSSFEVDPFDAIQILTPMHKGELGVHALNEKLQERLNPEGPSVQHGGRRFRLGDKVIQTRNNYELGVFNGDIGRLVSIDDQRDRIKVAFDDREVAYELGDRGDLALAYALSIHKSQGSEYPVVVIPLSMQHYVMLHRNLLYTAVTRGKRLVVLIGSRRALSTAVGRAKDLRRHSRLASRLAGDS